MISRIGLHKNKKYIVIIVLFLICFFAINWLKVSSPSTSRFVLQSLSKSFTYSHNVSCTITKNVVFLKTHKTAGTTVQNILMRYGIHHKLKFALPLNKHDYSYPLVFHSQRVMPFSLSQLQSSNTPDRYSYNIICHHMRFNYENIKSIMPNNTVYITIVREPGKLFQSTFDYLWSLVTVFQAVAHKEENAAEKWLDNAEQYFNKRKISGYSFFAKNHMMFDLGYNNIIETDTYIGNAIAEIDKVFDLVLIADHFDESIVLLSKLLCCQLEEVAYLSLNARSNLYEEDILKEARISEKASLWNKADAALFNYFNATLWDKIKNYGFDRMASDVKRLQIIKDDLINLCVEGGVPVSYSNLTKGEWRGSLYKPRGVSLTGYNLKRNAKKLDKCKNLIMTPRSLSNHIFKLQANLL